jgi:sugar/nucleoside kinase (ribokinase family)
MAVSRILGVGSPILDILVNVDDSFIDNIKGEKGGMELVSPEELDEILKKANSETVLIPGGSAANTIFGLANLGMQTAFLGKIGKDKQSDFYLSQYKKINGDMSHFKIETSLPTGCCLSLITPDSERTMRTDLGAAAALMIEEVTQDDFKNIDHVHLEGYLLFNRDLIMHILKIAKKANSTISLDLASFEVVNASKDILPEILNSYVDIVFANEEEAAAFTDQDNPEVALEKFSEYCETIAVKLGKDGAYIKSGNEIVRVDAEVVNALDTTGAGDLWASGFLYGFLNGKSLADAGKAGATVAAEVVQVIGASIPQETWGKLKHNI